jgi:hypothetical protein
MTQGKKTIGIFGDSFAYGWDGIKSVSTILLHAWPRILETKHNFNVLNYSLGGSSLFYSFKQFLDNYKKIDVALFVFTESNRLYHKDKSLRIGNLSSIEKELELLDVNDTKYQIYNAAQMYYKHLIDDEYNVYIRDKLAEDFIRICNENNIRSILIPGFDHDIKQAKYFATTLVEVSHQEIFKQFGDREYRPETKLRACHLSERNNRILADLLAKIINGDEFVIRLDDFRFIKVNDPENYWII